MIEKGRAMSERNRLCVSLITINSNITIIYLFKYTLIDIFLSYSTIKHPGSSN